MRLFRSWMLQGSPQKAQVKEQWHWITERFLQGELHTGLGVGERIIHWLPERVKSGPI